MSQKMFTVIGYYEDNGQRYCDHFEGETWVDAAQACAVNAGPESDLVIVEVIAGSHMGLTESNSVEAVVDFPVE